MAVSDSYREFVLEQVRAVQPVRARSMFGGVGIWAIGEPPDPFFGLIADDVLYFKVDGSNRADYTERGMAQFMTMQFYEVPGEVLEDQDELAAWMEKAIQVATRQRSK